jgi:DNA damage-binding protein 1
MKSLSILFVDSNDKSSPTGYSLVETSRHFATLWSAATAAINENEWVVADMEGNLITLRQSQDGTGPVGFNRRLEMTGEFRLGEVVNKIVPLLSNPSTSHEKQPSDPKRVKYLPREGPLVTPRAFLATIEGSIYMLGRINSPYLHVLLSLQTILGNRAQAPGYMPWSKYRAWKTEVVEKDEPFRIIDGEMLEQGLLALSDEEMVDVLRESGLDEEGGAQGRPVSVEEVRRWGEELRRLC